MRASIFFCMASLIAAATAPNVGEAQKFSPQQQEALGRAAGFYVGGAYYIELGTTGDCAGVLPKPTNHLQSVKTLVAKTPSSLKAELQSAFGNGAPDDVRRTAAEAGKRLSEMSRQIGGGKQFFCGALFGMGVTHKMRGMQEWLNVTGISLPLID